MPYRVYWDEHNDRILYHEYSGVVTAEEYIAVVDENWDLISPLDHTVHVIQDRRHVRSRVQSIFRALKYANSKTPSNLGLRVVVGADSYVKMLISLSQRIAPKLVRDVYFADSVEEAHSIITAHENTLKSV